MLLLAASAPGCGEGSHYEITEVRERARDGRPTPPGVTSADRFGDGIRGHGMLDHARAVGRPALAWVVPEGWARQPDVPGREVTLALADAPDVTCYVSILPGRAGGLAGNVNRWRRQMAQPPLAGTELDALPRVAALGTEGVLVEIAGDFTGMDGETQPGAMLLGLVVERERDTVFVKLVGPAEVVRPERGRFEAFCRSLEER